MFVAINLIFLPLSPMFISISLQLASWNQKFETFDIDQCIPEQLPETIEYSQLASSSNLLHMCIYCVDIYIYMSLICVYIYISICIQSNTYDEHVSTYSLNQQTYIYILHVHTSTTYDKKKSRDMTPRSQICATMRSPLRCATQVGRGDR